MSHVGFFVLGPVHAQVDGRWVDLGPVRQQAVFATLLFNRDRIVTREAILHAVWGDGAPPCGRKVIPPYIYRLRRILTSAVAGRPGPTIDTLRIGYRLRPGPATVDLADLEDAVARATMEEAAGDLHRAVVTLADAEKAWTGEPLAGLPGPFAQSRRQHLAESRIVGLERRLELAVRLGDYHAAIPELTALRAEFPLRERIASMLMLALYQTGRQGEAVTVFTHLRTDLVGQLGVEPTPATTRAYVSMLRGRPGLPRGEDRHAGPPTGHRPILHDHVAG
jgi:DNA-binding SARP family transcriptional activator